jgi:hypothetical protein
MLLKLRRDAIRGRRRDKLSGLKSVKLLMRREGQRELSGKRKKRSSRQRLRKGVLSVRKDGKLSESEKKKRRKNYGIEIERGIGKGAETVIEKRTETIDELIEIVMIATGGMTKILVAEVLSVKSRKQHLHPSPSSRKKRLSGWSRKL